MPVIRIRDARTAQPGYFAPVDTAHPIGARARFVLVGNSLIEVCRNLRPTGTIGTIQAAPGGLAYVTTGTTTWTGAIPELDPVISGSFTVNWHGVLRANTVQTLLRSSGGYGWRFDTTNYAADRLVFRLITAFGGIGYATPNVEVLDNTLHSVAVRYDDGAATAEIFLDGVSIGSGAYTKDANAMSGQAFLVIGHATLPHKMLTTQAYAGLLSNAGIAALAANPWQIFEPEAQSIWFSTTPAGTINLSGAASSQGNASSAAAITQVHALAGAASSQANEGDTAAITQVHGLTGSASTQANAASAGSIAQASVLTGADSSQANAASSGAITQTHVLTGATSTQDGTSAAIAITQVHVLAGDGATQANISGDGAIAVMVPFVGAPSTQANLSGTGRIDRPQTLAGANSVQVNLSSTGEVSDGIVTEAGLTTGIAASEGIKKPGIPAGTEEWLKTTLEILMGRRGNAVDPPKFQTLTFSATPTKAECEALYAALNDVRRGLNSLISRFDS